MLRFSRGVRSDRDFSAARVRAPPSSQEPRQRNELPRVGAGLHPGAAAAKSVGMNDKPTGIARGLTNYGDRDFSLYLRRSFAQSMGYSREMLAQPVVGIAYTASGFNNCHRHFP